MTKLDHLRNRDAVLRMSETEAEGRASVVDPDDERMIINMGPQHPSTHGVLRVTMELQGETVLRSKPVIGYLHTGMEKDCGGPDVFARPNKCHSYGLCVTALY